jgi:hypothetical protein
MMMTTNTRIQSRRLMPVSALYAWSLGSVVGAGVSEVARINRKDTNGGEVSG